MAHQSDQLFSTDDWVEIYRTGDEWEVRLIETTLQNQQIRCRPDYDRKSRQTTIFVAPEHQVDALEFVSRIGLVITDNQTPPGADDDNADRNQTFPQQIDADSNLPEATSTILEEVTVAEREGIGKIIHYVGRGYELQVGHKPYCIVEEERWEEFTDLSAQRHEFSILLKHEYPELLAWLKYEKLMAEFIRLVESTYRDVPPPRPRRLLRSNQSRPTAQQTETVPNDTKGCRIVKLSVCLSLVSLLVAVFQLPLYACAAFGVMTVGLALFGAYRINTADGGLKGTPLALIAVILALIAMAIGWRQSQSGSPQPDARIENTESGSGR